MDPTGETGEALSNRMLPIANRQDGAAPRADITILQWREREPNHERRQEVRLKLAQALAESSGAMDYGTSRGSHPAPAAQTGENHDEGTLAPKPRAAGKRQVDSHPLRRGLSHGD